MLWAVFLHELCYRITPIDQHQELTHMTFYNVLQKLSLATQLNSKDIPKIDSKSKLTKLTV
jgi:hypothetical protein